MAIESTNPATEEILKTFEEERWESVERKLEKAQMAFKVWRDLDIEKRAGVVKKAAEVLRAGKEEYARLMTLEMGKPIGQARAEVEKCAWSCEVAAERGLEWLKEEVVIQDRVEIATAAAQPRNDNPARAYVRFDPLGVVLAVMPWNFPFWQFFRFGTGALLAGNTIVLKHASNVPQSALAIEDIWTKAYSHTREYESKLIGLVQTVLVGSSGVEKMIADPRIAAVTLTGSTAAGKKVAETAGKYVKKCVLELGGSDAFIVLADADLPLACDAATQARTINSGQSCIAAKRFIVVREVAEEFTQQFVEKMRALTVGDPLDERTQVGPLARRDLVDELDRQVRESVAKGAQLLCGGKKFTIVNNIPKGYFYEPTVLAEVKPGMPAYGEELFGPVAAIIVAEDEEDAVRIANDSIYGLGAAIWSRDREKAQRLAARLEAGTVFINDFVKSDPRLSFGGIKQSGYGRELGSYGIKEFVNIKTLVVK